MAIPANENENESAIATSQLYMPFWNLAQRREIS